MPQMLQSRPVLQRSRCPSCSCRSVVIERMLDRFLPTPQVRQYFMDSDFYAADMTARGFCDEWAGCEAFTPSSATMKVSSLAPFWRLFHDAVVACTPSATSSSRDLQQQASELCSKCR